MRQTEGWMFSVSKTDSHNIDCFCFCRPRYQQNKSNCKYRHTMNHNAHIHSLFYRQWTITPQSPSFSHQLDEAINIRNGKKFQIKLRTNRRRHFFLHVQPMWTSLLVIAWSASLLIWLASGHRSLHTRGRISIIESWPITIRVCSTQSRWWNRRLGKTVNKTVGTVSSTISALFSFLFM